MLGNASKVPVKTYKFEAGSKMLHGTKVVPASAPSKASAPQAKPPAPASAPSKASAPQEKPTKKQKLEKTTEAANAGESKTTAWFKGAAVETEGHLPQTEDYQPEPEEEDTRCIQIPEDATRDQLRKALYDLGFKTDAWIIKCQKRNLNKQTQEFDRWELRCVCKTCDDPEQRCNASYTTNVKPGEKQMTVKKTTGTHAGQKENRWPKEE